jgi:hypothetical protein
MAVAMKMGIKDMNQKNFSKEELSAFGNWLNTLVIALSNSGIF